jgi:hypothetical protein
MTMETPAQNVSEEAAAEGPVYAYKASLMAAPFEFRLAPDAIEWRKGHYAGRTPYDQVRRVRLAYRPITMQNHRFTAEIWPASGPKLTVASTSWKSLVEQERLDGAYGEFILALNRRLADAGSRAQFQTGVPVFLYWPGVVVFVGAALAMAALVVRALQDKAWAGAAFIAAFLALFLWQAGNFFVRNKPGTYDPANPPPQVLPRTTSTEHVA